MNNAIETPTPFGIRRQQAFYDARTSSDTQFVETDLADVKFVEEWTVNSKL